MTSSFGAKTQSWCAMTNLLAMTTVQWVGVVMVVPMAVSLAILVVHAMKDLWSSGAWDRLYIFALVIGAIGLFLLLMPGCKPIDHQPDQSPEPTPTATPAPTQTQRLVRMTPRDDGWYDVTVTDMAGNVISRQQVRGGCRVAMSAGDSFDLPDLRNGCEWVQPRKAGR